jgi:HlyD family secretion protein
VKALVRRSLPIGIGLAVIAAVTYAFMPRPVRVDLAAVSRGPLAVAVEEDGKTRIKDRYIVSSPLAGRLLRIQLEAGDPVEAGKTILATIEPGDPSLLDPRAVAEAEARVKAAEARLKQAGTALEQSQAAVQFAENDLKRIQGLHPRGGTTQHELEEAQMKFRMRSEENRGARFAEEIARFELEQARAALLRTTPRSERPAGAKSPESLNSPPSAQPPMLNGDWLFQIRSPITGRVLRKFQESSTIVTAGAQLLQVGNPEDLEAEIDVLSADGVRISPGDKVLLEQWGGEKPLWGRVRLVEPAAFTKISSLGVEEQRVNVIVDFDDPPEKRRTLGDAFRVEAKIIIWESPNVLRVPIGALFRKDHDWAVFKVEEGRARLRTLKIGHRNGQSAEVLEGLRDQDEVVMHPSDQVIDQVRVTKR